MGVISTIVDKVVGSGVSVPKILDAVMPNAEASDERSFELQKMVAERAMSEVVAGKKGIFNKCVDGMNRLPRPVLALGVIALFGYNFVDPIGFSVRMQGLQLVPEPMWWLMGVVVSFYFGARHAEKAQTFKRDVAVTAASVDTIVAGMKHTQELKASRDAVKEEGETVPISENKPVSAAVSNNGKSAIEAFAAKMKKS